MHFGIIDAHAGELIDKHSEYLNLSYISRFPIEISYNNELDILIKLHRLEFDVIIWLKK